MKVVDDLHKLLCPYNHTDGCDYFYIPGQDKRDKATKVVQKLQALGINVEQLIKILRKVR